MKDSIEDVLENRNKADYRCYMALKMLIDNCDPEVLKDMIADYNGGEDDFAEDIVTEIQDALMDRDVVDTRFIMKLRENPIIPMKVIDKREKK